MKKLFIFIILTIFINYLYSESITAEIEDTILQAIDNSNNTIEIDNNTQLIDGDISSLKEELNTLLAKQAITPEEKLRIITLLNSIASLEQENSINQAVNDDINTNIPTNEIDSILNKNSDVDLVNIFKQLSNIKFTDKLMLKNNFIKEVADLSVEQDDPETAIDNFNEILEQKKESFFKEYTKKLLVVEGKDLSDRSEAISFLEDYLSKFKAGDKNININFSDVSLYIKKTIDNLYASHEENELTKNFKTALDNLSILYNELNSQ